MRARLTIWDLLAVWGITCPSRPGRIACVLHGGSNRQAFAYDRERWRCFACGERGDAIDLAQKHLRLSFRAALSYCAGLAGIQGHSRSRAEIRAAVRAAELARADRHRIERERWERWHAAVDRAARLSDDIMLRLRIWDGDRDLLDPIVARLVDELGPLYLAHEQALADVDEVEEMWHQERHQEAA